MAERKRLAELTIKNNFMFGAVMCDENNLLGRWLRLAAKAESVDQFLEQM